MKELFLDIETYSSVDLTQSSVYCYAESPDFELLLFGYSVDGGEIKVIDCANGETIPDEILNMLLDKRVTKYAHNVNFERICLSRYLLDVCNAAHPYIEERAHFSSSKYISPKNWRCSMVWGAYLGLPLSLESVGDVLNLDDKKLTSGKDLIRYFCKPCAPTQSNEGRTRNYPIHAPEKWDMFKAYNVRDVETELGVLKKLKRLPVPDEIWGEFEDDQKLNDLGILVDMELVKNAMRFDEVSKAELTRQMKEATGLENPNSVAQLKRWLSENGLEVEKLGKKDVAELIESVPPHIAEVLKLRLKLAKSSVKKYTAMENCVCADNRARGMFQFYGSHTGRESGRKIQLQNLTRGTIHGAELGSLRELVRNGDYEAVSAIYDDIPEALSSLVRTAFVPKPGCKFVVADFSAIEARVLAWLAGEEWVLDVFRTHGKIYEAAASRMYKIPLASVSKEQRQTGKTSTLACGYQGGVGSLKAFGADKLGLSDEELNSIVSDWREAHPNIVRFWYDMERAAKNAITGGEVSRISKMKVYFSNGMLRIKLPSGRELFYQKAQIATNRFGNPSIAYYGVNMAKKWDKIETYGGRLVENVTQAVARDLLFHSMKTLKHNGINVVAHIHDEVICEAPTNVTVEQVCEIMGQTPQWAQGFPLSADGYEGEFYYKA